jgi:hypothetical protein
VVDIAAEISLNPSSVIPEADATLWQVLAKNAVLHSSFGFNPNPAIVPAQSGKYRIEVHSNKPRPSFLPSQQEHWLLPASRSWEVNL